ncbi:MAG: hypothetical protein ACFB02_16110 [Mastigocoleus sp.]
MAPSLKFLDSTSKNISTRDTLALFTIGTFGLHLITFLILLLLYGSYSRLNQKPPPSLVQLKTGKSIKVTPIGNLERTPQVVSRFVSDTMLLMMNWSGKLIPATVEEANNPKPDPGIIIEGKTFKDKKITSGAWQASYALSEDFRQEFLTILASMTPEGVFKGKTQVVLVPLSIQPPIKVAEGKWKVKMIANLTVFKEANNLGRTIPFNKEIFVQAVEPPKSPISTNGLATIIYQIRSSGLEIYAIRDLQQENL